MTTPIQLAVIFLIVTAGALTASADQLSKKQVAKIEQAIATEMSKQGVPGMSVAVALKNRLCYANGFGHSDIENFVPARADTAYRTASIAKPMTAVAAMRLMERKKLDLDAPIRQYLPEFPAKRWPITSRQLMGHLGGVRHYSNSREATGTRHFANVHSALRLFSGDALLDEPGVKYRYSTYGYNLLGAVASRVSGKPFVKLLKESVFQPAGMTRTRQDDHFARITNRARGYVRYSVKAKQSFPGGEFKPGELYNAQMHDTSMKVPGGGLVSTAPDLVRFATAVNRGELLKPASLKSMWTQQRTKAKKPTGYGLGWSIGVHKGEPLITHGGGQAGTATYLLLLPKRKTAVAIMCNLQGAKLVKLSKQIADLTK